MIDDRRIASLSLDLIPQENRRTSRSLSQALLAGELHDAVILCLKESKLMPTAALLRSLIDTCVLGIWLLRYAKDEEVPDSVARLSTPEIVKNVFVGIDQNMFAFVFEEVKGTDHQFYRDVLHPSIHGDALHIAMRLRDEKSRSTWVSQGHFPCEPRLRAFHVAVRGERSRPADARILQERESEIAPDDDNTPKPPRLEGYG